MLSIAANMILHYYSPNLFKMENKNVESTIHAILQDGQHPLQVTSQTREILTIISAYRCLYADLLEWFEKYHASDDRLNDEAFKHWQPFIDYLEKWLVESITQNTCSTPFKGI